MRNIKFRAYVKFLNEIQNVTELYNTGGCMVDGYPYALAHDDVNLMKFTGLQDKNGVDIYEGDIVNISGSGSCITEIQPCYGIVYKCINKNMFDTDAHDVAAEREDSFVIGNIHSNPELLEQ